MAEFFGNRILCAFFSDPAQLRTVLESAEAARNSQKPRTLGEEVQVLELIGAANMKPKAIVAVAAEDVEQAEKAAAQKQESCIAETPTPTGSPGAGAASASAPASAADLTVAGSPGAGAASASAPASALASAPASAPPASAPASAATEAGASPVPPSSQCTPPTEHRRASFVEKTTSSDGSTPSSARSGAQSSHGSATSESQLDAAPLPPPTGTAASDPPLGNSHRRNTLPARMPSMRKSPSRRRNSMPTDTELLELQELFASPSSERPPSPPKFVPTSPIAQRALAGQKDHAPPRYGKQRSSKMLSIPLEVTEAVERMRAEGETSESPASCRHSTGGESFKKGASTPAITPAPAFAKAERQSFTEARVDYARRASAKGVTATCGINARRGGRARKDYRTSRVFFSSGNEHWRPPSKLKLTGQHTNVSQIGPADVCMGELLPAASRERDVAAEFGYIMAVPRSSGNAMGIAPEATDRAVVRALVAKSSMGPEDALARAAAKERFQDMCNQAGMW